MLFSTNSQTLPVLLQSLSSLFSFVSLFISVSLCLFHLFFSSLCFCAVAFSAVACSVLCCCVLLCVVVLCVCACLCVSLSHVSRVEQCVQVKRIMEDSATCCTRPVLKLKIGNMHGFFVEPLEHVTTPRGSILVSRTDDDLLILSPCARAKRPVCTGTTPTCVYTCGRVANTHGDVLNVHTEGLSACHTTPHHTAPHRTHTYTTTTRQRQRHNLQLHSTHHGRTHQVQTQQGLTVRSFLILRVGVHVRSQLVKGFVWLFPLTSETLALLNHVKYDPYLITSQRDRSRTHP